MQRFSYGGGIDSILDKTNNTGSDHNFQGIEIKWIHSQGNKQLNNFSAYILSRPNTLKPNTLARSDNLIVFVYSQLSNTLPTDAIVVGVGTGQTSDSWFSFEMQKDTGHFIKELTQKSNNVDDIGGKGYWSWFIKGDVTGRREDDANRTCPRDATDGYTWQAFTLHQRSSLRLKKRPCKDYPDIWITRTCTLDLFNKARWTMFDDTLCGLLEGEQWPEQLWDDQSTGANFLLTETNNMMTNNMATAEMLNKIAKFLNDYLSNPSTIHVEEIIANTLADVIGSVMSLNDSTIFRESGSSFLESVELLGIKVRLSDSSDTFQYLGQTFRMDVQPIPDRTKRNTDFVSENIAEIKICNGMGNTRYVRYHTRIQITYTHNFGN